MKSAAEVEFETAQGPVGQPGAINVRAENVREADPWSTPASLLPDSNGPDS